MSKKEYLLHSILIIVIISSFSLSSYLFINKSSDNTSGKNVAAVTQAFNQEKNGRVLPSLNLPKSLNGKEAIAAIGNKLPEVARWYGLTESELENHFKNDKSLFIDKNSRLFYLDDNAVGVSINNAAAIGDVLLSPPGGLFPLDQTFRLHSKPGSTRTIYLDFNGHLLSGTAWNSGYNSSADIIAPPFDLDGVPSSFSDAELSRIQRIWQRVAEDYVAFNVDVTTELLDESVITRSSTSDQNYGTRVLISPIGKYFGSYGGIAYRSAFDDIGDFYKPALVFPENLGGGGEKYVAEAISHEAGHNLGLSHDGDITGVTYYKGQGVWAPIMGNSYYRPVTQFSKGEYVNANNFQDDLSVIASFIPMEGDDYGNTLTSAFPVNVSGNNISVAGFIETIGDVDFFSFSTGAVTTTFNVNVATIEPNLNTEISLYNSSGVLLLTQDPTTLSSSLTATLQAGTYYLSIRGIGSGDPAVDGYSNYGSLGQYYLTGVIDSGDINLPPTTVNQPPVASFTINSSSYNIPVDVTFDASESKDADGTVSSYSWDFGDGSIGVDAVVTHAYTKAGSYPIKLTVTDNSGLSASKTVSITTIDPNAIIAPSNLTASAPGNVKGVANLNWTYAQNNNINFYVERAPSVKTGSLIYSRVATIPANTNIFADKVSSGLYYYRVQAYDIVSGKISNHSNVASVRVK